MNDGLFHFKRFSVAHTRSSMKVGVDAVLIGAWADCEGGSILDVGTGCGVIALMMAQRNPAAIVHAIDVDSASVEEAACNFSQSRWGRRLSACKMQFSELTSGDFRFDRIVSNPPYFDSGVRDFTTSRNVARHQGELSPSVLLRGGGGLLTDSGKLAMIVPSEFYDRLGMEAEEVGLSVERACFVKASPKKQAKRVMMEFCLGTGSGGLVTETLTMFCSDGTPTDEYRLLESEFYLKF